MSPVTDATADRPRRTFGAAFANVIDSILTASPPATAITTPTEGQVSHRHHGDLPPDSDTLGIPSNYNASIDRGDGTPNSQGTIVATGTPGLFEVMGTPHLRRRDHDAVHDQRRPSPTTSARLPTTATTTVSVLDATLVNPAGIPAFGTVGQSLANIPLGTFADNNPIATAADYTVSINWGPGALVPITTGFATLTGGNGTQSFFSVSGSVDYTTAGIHPVTITITDDGGQSTTIDTTVTVSSSALSAAVLPITGVEGNPTTAGVVATFTEGNGTEPASNFFVTLNWGDGHTIDTTSGLTVVNNGNGSYSVTAPAHTYAEEGVYVVTVAITDSAGPSTTAANLAVVSDAPLTGSNGGSSTVVQGNSLTISPLVTFTDANPKAPLSDFTATINWGDGTFSLGTITQPGGIGTAQRSTCRAATRSCRPGPIRPRS